MAQVLGERNAIRDSALPAAGLGSAMRSGLFAQFELFRPANVTTAVADVLAGYAAAALGNPAALPWLVVASACLYGGGVVLNDFFDRELDALERPERPIPSGRVGPAAAATVGATLLLIGVVAASLATRTAGAIACGIAGLVLLYDSWGKRLSVVGPVNMGLCRALNLLLGIAAVPAALADRWPLALLAFVYIHAVTALSRGEVHRGTRGVALFALVSVFLVVAALLVVSLYPPHPSVAGFVLTAVFGWCVLPSFWRAYNDSQSALVRNAVKNGVLSLVVLDAVIGATYGGALYGVMVLATLLVAAPLAKVFAVA